MDLHNETLLERRGDPSLSFNPYFNDKWKVDGKVKQVRIINQERVLCLTFPNHQLKASFKYNSYKNS